MWARVALARDKLLVSFATLCFGDGTTTGACAGAAGTVDFAQKMFIAKEGEVHDLDGDKKNATVLKQGKHGASFLVIASGEVKVPIDC